MSNATFINHLGVEQKYIKEYVYERVPCKAYPGLWEFGSKRIGLLVAVHDAEANVVVIGWSKCNNRDNYNNDVAHKIALGRATLGASGNQIPFDFEAQIDRFAERCQRYFKDKSVVLAGRMPGDEFEITSVEYA